MAGRDWRDSDGSQASPLLSPARAELGEEQLKEICLNIYVYINGFETETLEGIRKALENYWEDFPTVKLTG